MSVTVNLRKGYDIPPKGVAERVNSRILVSILLCRNHFLRITGPPIMNNAVVKMPDSLGVQAENISFDDFGI